MAKGAASLTAEALERRCGPNVVREWELDEVEARRLAPAALVYLLSLHVVVVSTTVTWPRPLSTGLPCRGILRTEKRVGGARTWGSTAQNAGEALRRVRTRTIPIFPFSIMVRRSAVKVRLLPEYDCVHMRLAFRFSVALPGTSARCRRLRHGGSTHHLVWIDEVRVFDVVFEG